LCRQTKKAVGLLGGHALGVGFGKGDDGDNDE